MTRTNPRPAPRPAFGRNGFRADERGVVSIIAALVLLFVILPVAAVVVDAGSMLLARRTLQTATDAAALAAASNLDKARERATTALKANLNGEIISTTELGHYDRTQALGARFASTSDPDQIDSVRVTTQATAPMYFSRALGFSSLANIGATATASIVKTASIQAGARLASFDSDRVLIVNQLLNGLTGGGTAIALTAVDYNGLLDTDISTLAFLDAVATKIGLSSTSTYSDLLNANVTIGNLLDTSVDVLQGPSANSVGDVPKALNALQTLRNQMPPDTSIKLVNVIDVPAILNKTIGSLSGSSSALSNLYSLTASMARSAGAGTVVNLDTGLTIPLTGSSIQARIAVGEAVQMASGPVGTSVHTAQVRIALTLQLADVAYDSGNPLLGIVAGTNISLPIYIEAAEGTGVIKSIPCTTSSKVVLTGTSGAVKIQYGSVTDSQMTNFDLPVTATTPATVATVRALGLDVATISANGLVDVASHGPEDLTFSEAQIDSKTSQTVPSSGGGTFISSNGPGALHTSIALLPGTNLGPLINPLLNAALSPFLSTVTNLLTSSLSLLDAPVNLLLDTLGLRLGEVDLAVTGPRSDKKCGIPILVQ